AVRHCSIGNKMSSQTTRTQRVPGKVVLVTGAASGIGRSTALLLCKHGARLVCADIDLPGAVATTVEARKAGGSAAELLLDVSSETSWQRAIAESLERYSKLDVLVNCAGVSSALAVTETSLEDWRRVMAINLDGVFLGTKHALLVM